MIEYLDDWAAAEPLHRPKLPPRTFSSAKRFLTWVLDGVALSRRGEAASVPTMAALSNLTIAVEVLTALPVPVATDLDAVQSSVRSYLDCLTSLQESSAASEVTPATVEEMQRFFAELLRQGNAAQYSEFARGEQPVH
jgi:hypothetical protein